MQTGLVNEARNARPLLVTRDAEKKDRRPSLSLTIATSQLSNDIAVEDDHLDIRSPTRLPVSETAAGPGRGRSPEHDVEAARLQLCVQPAKPEGVYVSGSVYAGRALAEWSLVVAECNSFVDRRRDEGVLGLNDVEVPTLSVEGLGQRQRA